MAKPLKVQYNTNMARKQAFQSCGDQKLHNISKKNDLSGNQFAPTVYMVFFWCYTNHCTGGTAAPNSP
jgi:hypothetical protein